MNNVTIAGLGFLALLCVCCGCRKESETEAVSLKLGHVGHDHHLALYVAADNAGSYGKESGVGLKAVEDRKFYDVVATRDSPWKVAGPVTMDREGSFVGDHTPRIAGGSAIAQGGLGLVAGKQYVGYVWLKGSGPVDVTLRWGKGADDRQTVAATGEDGRYTQTSFRFTAGATTDEGQLTVAARGEKP